MSAGLLFLYYLPLLLSVVCSTAILAMILACCLAGVGRFRAFAAEWTKKDSFSSTVTLRGKSHISCNIFSFIKYKGNTFLTSNLN